MTKSISYEATEWFCDNCPASGMVIRKNTWDSKLPVGWHVRKIKSKKWYENDKWELRCDKCVTPSWLNC